MSFLDYDKGGLKITWPALVTVLGLFGGVIHHADKKAAEIIFAIRESQTEIADLKRRMVDAETRLNHSSPALFYDNRQRDWRMREKQHRNN